jgi:hypothetical protein
MEKLNVFQLAIEWEGITEHTRREKTREEQDAGHLTYINERRRSRSCEEEETAAPGHGGGRRQELGEAVTGSRSSWTPAAEARGGNQRLALHASPPPVMRRRENLPARCPSHRPCPPPSFTIDSPSSLTPATRRTGCSGRLGSLRARVFPVARRNRGVVCAGGRLD